jgi:hypothetical protein
MCYITRMKTSPESAEHEHCNIIREGSKWLALGAVVAVGAQVEKRVLGQDPAYAMRVAKTLAMVCGIRVFHGIAANVCLEVEPSPGQDGTYGPPPSLGEMIVAEPIVTAVDTVRQRVQDRLYDYVTA